MKKTAVLLATFFSGLLLLALFSVGIQTVEAKTMEGYSSSLNIISPANTTYSSNSLLLNVTIKRAFSPNEYDSKIMYSLNGEANVTVPSIATFFDMSTPDSIWSALGSYTLITGATFLPKLPQGSYFLTVYGIYNRAKGVSGKYPELMQDTKTVYFTMNYGIPPTIANLQIENKTYNQNSLPLNFTTYESISWMGYSLDGKANVTLAGNTTLLEIARGIHNLTVYANDTVGNMGTTETVYFRIEVPKQEPLSLTLVGATTSVAVIILGLIILFKKRKN